MNIERKQTDNPLLSIKPNSTLGLLSSPKMRLHERIPFKSVIGKHKYSDQYSGKIIVFDLFEAMVYCMYFSLFDYHFIAVCIINCN